MQAELFDLSPQPPQRPYSIPVYKIALVRESALKMPHRPRVISSVDVAEIVRTYLVGTDREHFLVLTLDTKNHLIGLNTVSIGSLSSSLAHPREVMKLAILQNAAAIIVAHNHPSSDVTASQEDRNLTERLKQVGDLLGIRLLDHVIVGDGTERFCSFADDGLL
jgi:DNA repair protein RadC